MQHFQDELCFALQQLVFKMQMSAWQTSLKENHARVFQLGREPGKLSQSVRWFCFSPKTQIKMKDQQSRLCVKYEATAELKDWKHRRDH